MSVNAIICLIVSLGISGYFWLCGNVLVSFLNLNSLPRMGIGLIINALMMTIVGMFIQDGYRYWMVMLIIILISFLCTAIYFLFHFRYFNWKYCIIGLTILIIVSLILFWNFRIKAYTLGTLSPAIDQVEVLMNGYINNEVIVSYGSVLSYCQWFDQFMIGILQLVSPIAGFENLIFVLTYISALIFFFLLIDISFAVCDGLTKWKLVVGLIVVISIYLGFYYDLNHYYFSFLPVSRW